MLNGCINLYELTMILETTLRWFDHMEREKSEEFVKKYTTETENPRKARRLVVKYKDRVIHHGLVDHALDSGSPACILPERAYSSL